MFTTGLFISRDFLKTLTEKECYYSLGPQILIRTLHKLKTPTHSWSVTSLHCIFHNKRCPQQTHYNLSNQRSPLPPSLQCGTMAMGGGQQRNHLWWGLFAVSVPCTYPTGATRWQWAQRKEPSPSGQLWDLRKCI